MSKKGMVNRLALWYTDYIHIDEKCKVRTAKTSFFFSSAIEKKKTGGALCHRRERENAMLDTLYNGFAGLVGTLNDLMYSYVLIILLLAAGVYFTIRTAGVQVRLLGESVRVVSEKNRATPRRSARLKR